jgi:hypothetical protein
MAVRCVWCQSTAVREFMPCCVPALFWQIGVQESVASARGRTP